MSKTDCEELLIKYFLTLIEAENDVLTTNKLFFFRLNFLEKNYVLMMNLIQKHYSNI